MSDYIASLGHDANTLAHLREHHSETLNAFRDAAIANGDEDAAITTLAEQIEEMIHLELVSAIGERFAPVEGFPADAADDVWAGFDMQNCGQIARAVFFDAYP